MMIIIFCFNIFCITDTQFLTFSNKLKNKENALKNNNIFISDEHIQYRHVLRGKFLGDHPVD